MQADLSRPGPTAATSQVESNGMNAGCWAQPPNNGKITAVFFSGSAQLPKSKWGFWAGILPLVRVLAQPGLVDYAWDRTPRCPLFVMSYCRDCVLLCLAHSLFEIFSSSARRCVAQLSAEMLSHLLRINWRISFMFDLKIDSKTCPTNSILPTVTVPNYCPQRNSIVN